MKRPNDISSRPKRTVQTRTTCLVLLSTIILSLVGRAYTQSGEMLLCMTLTMTGLSLLSTSNATFWTSNALTLQLYSVSSSISSLNASTQLGCLQQCSVATSCQGVVMNASWCSGLTDLGPSQLKPTTTAYSLYVKQPPVFASAGATYLNSTAVSVCDDNNCNACVFDDPTVQCHACNTPLLPYGRTCVASCPSGQLATTSGVQQVLCLRAGLVFTVATPRSPPAPNFLNSYLTGSGLSFAVSTPLSINARFVDC